MAVCAVFRFSIYSELTLVIILVATGAVIVGRFGIKVGTVTTTTLYNPVLSEKFVAGFVMVKSV